MEASVHPDLVPSLFEVLQRLEIDGGRLWVSAGLPRLPGWLPSWAAAFRIDEDPSWTVRLSSSAAFVRAFERWTGTTPGAWRRRARRTHR